MSRPLLLALILSLPMLLVGIHWGLPSRAGDPFLFGDRTPWTGQEITALAGGWGAERQGADVQRDPLLDRSAPAELNDTDARRADLVRRYRLYTYQPDEMINLRALSQMRPARLQLDPKLYQYGGGWFYPAGAALGAAHVAGVVRLVPDVAWYLDHPEQAGRLYVVLRLMSVVWALAGVAAVYAILRLMNASPWVAAAGGLAFGTMPGIVIFAHEAKPHVAGVTLVLWSVAAGLKFVLTGKRGWLWTSAAVAGLAFGTVVSMLPAMLVPLTAAYIRRAGWKQAIVAVGLFAGVYFAANPYVLKHLLTDRALLTGQIGNSTAMYGLTSPLNAIQTAFFLAVMVSPAVLLVFPVTGVMLNEKRFPLGLQMLTPVVAAAGLIFVLLAGGKPGEYARFGLMLGAGGCVLAGWLGTRFARPLSLPLAVIVFHVLMSAPEVAAYQRDASPTNTSRLTAAAALREVSPRALTLSAEPAPYNTPPVDLWQTRLVLSPVRAAPSPDDLPLAQPPQSDGYWRLSWADRAFSLPSPPATTRPE